MNRRLFLASFLGMMALPGCGLILSGSKSKDERGRFSIGFLLLDIVFGVFVVTISANGVLLSVPLFIIIDLATGGIYRRSERAPIDVEDDDDLPERELGEDPLTGCFPRTEIMLCAEGRGLVQRNLRNSPRYLSDALAVHLAQCTACQDAFVAGTSYAEPMLALRAVHGKDLSAQASVLQMRQRAVC